MKTIEFKGIEVAYDESVVNSFSFAKSLSMVDTKPSAMFSAIDKLLCGNSDEYAESLGDSMEEMTGLISAITDAESAKN